MSAPVIERPYDTTPGGAGLFSPPAGFAGDGEAYRAWIKTQWESGNTFQQWMLVLTRRVCLRGDDPIPVYLTGPYADALETACRNLDRWLESTPAAQAA